MARFMPVTVMVEYIFYRTVKMFNERRTKATVNISNGNVYCVEPRKQFEVIEKKATAHNVQMYNRQVGVNDVTTTQYRSGKRRNRGNLQVVKLMEMYCSCGKWKTNGCPCSHVVAACMHSKVVWTQ